MDYTVLYDIQLVYKVLHFLGRGQGRAVQLLYVESVAALKDDN